MKPVLFFIHLMSKSHIQKFHWPLFSGVLRPPKLACLLSGCLRLEASSKRLLKGCGWWQESVVAKPHYITLSTTSLQTRTSYYHTININDHRIIGLKRSILNTLPLPVLFIYIYIYITKNNILPKLKLLKLHQTTKNMRFLKHIQATGARQHVQHIRPRHVRGERQRCGQAAAQEAQKGWGAATTQALGAWNRGWAASHGMGWDGVAMINGRLYSFFQVFFQRSMEEMIKVSKSDGVVLIRVAWVLQGFRASVYGSHGKSVSHSSSPATSWQNVGEVHQTP